MEEGNKTVENSDVNNDKLDENALVIDTEKENNPKIIDTDSDDYKEMQENKDEFTKNKKRSKLNKILFGLIGLLILLLIIGAVLYFLGFFSHDKDESTDLAKNEEQHIEQPTQKEEPATYKFNIKDINSKKLNEQLATLTNKNINQEKNEELEKKENEKKLIEEQKKKEEEALKVHEASVIKEKKMLEDKKTQLENEKAHLEAMKQEALRLKQELQVNKDKLESTTNENEPKSNEKENAINPKETEAKVSSNTEFLKLINVAKIKGNLYKKYLDRVSKVNASVLLCRDDKNRIEIYYGPFNDESERKELLEKLITNKFEQSYELELTKEEFNRRCNY